MKAGPPSRGFALDLVAASGCVLAEAQSVAWAKGLRRLDAAIARGHSHAFEISLGGRTLAALLATAARYRHGVLL